MPDKHINNTFEGRVYWGKRKNANARFDLTYLQKESYDWFLQEQRKNLASLFSHFPLRYSAMAGLCWDILDHMLMKQSGWNARALEEASQKESQALQHSFVATGPLEHYDSTGALLSALAAYWKRGSQQMRHLAESNGMLYFHFLQPNQYLPRSKPMGAYERAIAYSDTQWFIPYLVEGYPLLSQAGKELQREGEHFHDLTMLFAGVREPLYVDNCCHYNLKGDHMFSEAIGKAVLEDLHRAPAK